MRTRHLLSALVFLLSVLAYLPARAANVATLTFEDTPLHGSYACTYFAFDTAPVAAALGLTDHEFAGYSQSGEIKVGTETADGSVSYATNAGADGYNGHWLNSAGVQSAWAGGNIFFVWNSDDMTIGVGQMPTSESGKTHCEPGASVLFHAVFQYNGNEAVVEVTYKSTYKSLYTHVKAEAEAALANPDYAAVPAALRTALQSAVGASVEETEDAWLQAGNAIRQALDAYLGSVTTAGTYVFKEGPSHTSFACSYFDIDIQKIASVLGLTVDEFRAGYDRNLNGSTVTMGVYDNSGNFYTATSDAGEGDFIGYWMNKKGQRCGWGSEASFYFVYDPSGRIGIGQMPTSQGTGDKVAAGDKITFNIIFKTATKSATVQVTYILTYGDWLRTLVEATPDYSNLSGETFYTKELVDAYIKLREATLAQCDDMESEDQVMAVYNPLKQMADSVAANISLWATYKKAVDKAQAEVLDDLDYVVWTEGVERLEEYVGDANNYLAECALSNDELQAEIDKLAELYKQALMGGVKPGANITNKYLVNADFEVTSGKETGWTVEGNNVNYGGSDKNHCIEGSNSASFDVYQVLKDMPVGLYTVKVNGFYRYGNGTSSLTYYQDGTAAEHQNSVQVYVNGNASSLPNVYDVKVPVGTDYTEGNAIKDADEVYWYPNNMTDAGVAFKAGRYEAGTYGVVTSAADALRVGVKGSTNTGASWAIWDNFDVVYEGTEPTAVKPVLQDKISEVQALLANGSTYGSDVVAAANDELSTASAAAEGTDGEAMFQSLCNLISRQAALVASAEALDSLAAQKTALAQAISLFGEGVPEAVVTEASTLQGEVESRLAAKNLTTAEARAYVVKMAEVITKLRLPYDDEVTDYTSVIINPGFDNDGQGVNSLNGWSETGEAHSFGNSDYQKNALLVEYHKVFDIHQTIYGLPDGQYKVGVSCFSRYGSLSNDYQVWSADNKAENNAFLYAETASGDSVKQSVAFISSGAYAGAGISGQTSIDGKNVPNDMVSAGMWFDNGYYKNEVTVDVRGGKLTIGVRKDRNTGDDWLILDNWTLEYLGKEMGVGKVSTGKVVSTEYFSVDGMKLSAPQRGLNIIRTTTADGKTVGKVIVVK